MKVIIVTRLFSVIVSVVVLFCIIEPIYAQGKYGYGSGYGGNVANTSSRSYSYGGGRSGQNGTTAIGSNQYMNLAQKGGVIPAQGGLLRVKNSNGSISIFTYSHVENGVAYGTYKGTEKGTTSSGGGGGGGSSVSRFGTVNYTPPPPAPGVPGATVKAIALKAPGEFVASCDRIASVAAYLTSPSTYPDSTESAYLATTSAYLSDTVFALLPWGIASQPGSTPVTFSNVTPFTYSLISTYKDGALVPHAYCLGRGASPGTWANTSSVTLASNDVVVFRVGFSQPYAWFQTAGGGNTFAGKTVVSKVGSTANPKKYDLSGTSVSYPSSPGIVSAVAGMDFAPDVDAGLDVISSANWNTNNTMPLAKEADIKDVYQYFSFKVKDATLSADLTLGKPSCSLPVSGTKQETVCAYYPTDLSVSGNTLTIDTAWTINDGEKYVIVVPGNLTIKAPITLSGVKKSGFIAFVVKGDITIDPLVGGAYTSTTPQIEGMYMTNGIFHTGYATDASKERLVLKGMFIAGDVALERSLSTTNHNGNTSSELFFYNPQFLLTMPKILKDIVTNWQEVAP